MFVIMGSSKEFSSQQITEYVIRIPVSKFFFVVPPQGLRIIEVINYIAISVAQT